MELTEGCNRICSFCGLNGIRNKPGNYLHMGVRTAEAAAKGLSKLCPTARYEFAMHGEPLQHPKFLDIISIYRKWLPKAQFSLATNGRVWLGGAMQTGVVSLFEAGIDIIILDTYDPERRRLHKRVAELKDIDVRDFYEDCVPTKFSPYHNHQRKVRGLLVVMDDIGMRDGEVKSRTVMNHAGNADDKPLPPEPLKKTCTLPFREMSICYDGDVNICCMDWGHEYVCGNVNENTPKEIWEGAVFMAARKVLGQKNREFSPCNRCDAGSGSRAGLLPKLGVPTPTDLVTVRGTVERQTGRNYVKLKAFHGIEGSTCGLPKRWDEV